MAAKGFSLLAILTASAMVASAGARAQTVAAPPATAPTAAVAPDPAVHDRVLALVQARKCNAAHDEAIAGGDALLAQQVSELCGLKPATDGGARGGRKSGGPKPPGR